jgi:RNA recognition motif-containing protein
MQEERDMTKIIFVGNLPAEAMQDQLRDLFSPAWTRDVGALDD